MRKTKHALCVLAALAVAALAAHARAQKQSGDAPLKGPSDAQAKAATAATGEEAAEQDANAKPAAATQREATAHPDTPTTSDSKPHPDCPLMPESKQRADCPMKGGEKTSDGDKTSGGESSAARAGARDAHLAAVSARGEEAMGFSQSETTHHFILNADGGVIQVEVKDPNDASSREQIRRHLAHVARAFAAGDFDTPMLVHARVPPGVPAMRRLKSEIGYAYEETERGARVRIKTKNAEALAAVHDFLRFQITDHETGDPLEVR